MAVCAREGGKEASESAVAAVALVLEVAAQSVPEEKGRSREQLEAAYTQADLEQELPGGVCGEESGRHLKVSDIAREAAAGGAPVMAGFSARVVCPPIDLLRVPERTAQVRYVSTGAGIRYRVMARAPTDHFGSAQKLIYGFLSSFRLARGPD